MKQPRPYQQEAINSTIEEIKKYARQGKSAHLIIDAGPGAGKTLLMAFLAKHVFERGGRVVQLARQPILAKQNYDEMYECGIPAALYAAKFNRRQVAQVTVATEGTIANSLHDMNKPVDLLLLDECHTLSPDDEDTQMNTIIRHLDDVTTKAGRKMHVVGLTGSPFRGVTPLTSFDFWHDTVFNIGTDKLTELGYLSVPVFGFADADDDALDFSSVNTRSGSWEFSEKELDEIAMSDAGKKKLVRILMQVIEKTKDRNQRIVFASTKRHAREIRRILIALGIDKSKIGLVTDDSSEAEKDRVIMLSKEGKLDWLINVSVLTTGFNSPLIDVVVYLRPIGSLVLLIQSMGRGARLLEDWMKEAGFHKENYLVLDYAGVFDRLGHLLDDPTTGEALAQRDKSRGEDKPCPRCHEMNSKAARRCRGKDESELDKRCGFFWTSQTCPDCGTENDIAATECRNPSCRRELRDSNKALLHHPYSDDEMVGVKKMDVLNTKGGALMVRFTLDGDERQPYLIFPMGGELSRRILKKEFVDVYVQPGWRGRVASMKTAEQIVKMSGAFMTPKAIAYRINGNNKYVVGRRKFS